MRKCTKLEGKCQHSLELSLHRQNIADKKEENRCLAVGCSVSIGWVILAIVSFIF